MLLAVVRHNHKLANKRVPQYEQNRYGKFMLYFGIALMAAYLIFIGVGLAITLKEGSIAYEPYQVFNRYALFLFALDFCFRFSLQKSLTADMKPYLLLPVRRSHVLSCTLLQKAFASINFFWLFLIIPFGYLTVYPYWGLSGTLSFIAYYTLLFVLNGYWYLLVRSLMTENLLYVALPIAFYVLYFLAEFLITDGLPGRIALWAGEWVIRSAWWVHLIVLAAIALIFYILLRLQLSVLYSELNKLHDTRVKHISSYDTFNRFGLLGQYIRLELKLQLRNKMPKRSFLSGMGVMMLFALLLSFSDIYDQEYSRNFILIYNFCILPLVTLMPIMEYEGNYLDGLMTRRGSLIGLFRAKYYLTCIAELMPLAVMMAAVWKGKLALLSVLALYLLNTGVMLPGIMCMALFNKRTRQLNASMMNKGQISSPMQMLITFGVLTIPYLLISVLQSLLSPTATCWVLLTIGLTGMLFHPYWIRWIYFRFMNRRYTLLDSYRSTR